MKKQDVYDQMKKFSDYNEMTPDPWWREQITILMKMLNDKSYKQYEGFDENNVPIKKQKLSKSDIKLRRKIYNREYYRNNKSKGDV